VLKCEAANGHTMAFRHKLDLISYLSQNRNKSLTSQYELTLLNFSRESSRLVYEATDLGKNYHVKCT